METSGQNNEGGIPYKVKAGAFLAFAGGFGLLAGFGGALAQVKKQDPGAYDMGSGKPGEGEESGGTAGNWCCTCIKSFSLGDLLCCGRLWDSFLLHLEVDGGSEYDRIYAKGGKSIAK